MKYSEEQVIEARDYGWTIDPILGTWSSDCIVCGKYSVIPTASAGACQPCITELSKERDARLEAMGYNLEELDDDNPFNQCS